MNKLKVITVVGTRPEIIRLSRIIPKLDQYCDHILVHTGQNYDYELNQIFFEQLEIRKPDYFLDAAGKNGVETIGYVIIKVDELLEKINPEALLILGDTNSCISVIPAKRRKIPTFHMEAGNRCYDMRVPEEINRKIIDHTSDINMPYSSIAREYLLKEGFPADQIIKTGSPMSEVLNYYKDKIETSDMLTEMNLESGKYFLISSHREENVDDEENLIKLMMLLNGLVEKYDIPVVVSTHPRTKNRMDKIEFKMNNKVQFMKPFGFLDYIKLQTEAKCVLSDSGTISEESSILNFPALNLREQHERPEGMEEGAVMMVGQNLDRVFQALEVINDQPRNNERLLEIVEDYKTVNVSDKVLRIILSYTDYVNSVVWKK